ncbi:MAG: hypothetical protein PHU85_00605 [Phycisphaerae bacterium]|nr:hypothetical protein [Phycisphaerae bacterium]
MKIRYNTPDHILFKATLPAPRGKIDAKELADALDKLHQGIVWLTKWHHHEQAAPTTLSLKLTQGFKAELTASWPGLFSTADRLAKLTPGFQRLLPQHLQEIENEKESREG